MTGGGTHDGEGEPVVGPDLGNWCPDRHFNRVPARVLPLMGLMLASVGALWGAVRRPRMWAASGLLIGAGGGYLLLLARAAASCQTISEPGYFRDCTAPANLVIFQLGAAGLLVTGIVLLVLGLWEGSRRH